jgi:DNA-binding transcriptional ArsR family regulator
LIDRIRQDIQDRLEQLLAEADKLRRALTALGPWERAAPEPKPVKTKPAAKRPVKNATASNPKPVRARARVASPSSGGATPARAASGQTRAKVLAALLRDTSRTAGEVAELTGLARPTVSTTLSRLAKSGQVVKADRGYRLPGGNVNAATPVAPADTDASTS